MYSKRKARFSSNVSLYLGNDTRQIHQYISHYNHGVVPHEIIWSWYTGRWWVGCYIWCSKEGTGRGPSPLSPLLAVPNATAHPSTASVPITVFMYNGHNNVLANNPASRGIAPIAWNKTMSYRAGSAPRRRIASPEAIFISRTISLAYKAC